MRIDRDVAVIVCAGPSLDRLSAAAWRALQQAGAVIGVNGAPAADACARHDVAFSLVAAMDIGSGLFDRVPRLASIWETTRAWRVTSTDCAAAAAESYIREVDEADGVDGWSDDPDEGYKGGSTGMIVGNWIANGWPRGGVQRHRRGFRRLAYIGLDMHADDGGHAAGAGTHASGFARSREQHRRVCDGWGKFCAQAARRGVDVVNLTPRTGLDTMPCAALPDEWVTP